MSIRDGGPPFRRHERVRWTDASGTFEGEILDAYRDMGLYEWEIGVRIKRIIKKTERGQSFFGRDYVVGRVLNIPYASARWTRISAVDQLAEIGEDDPCT